MLGLFILNGFTSFLVYGTGATNFFRFDQAVYQGTAYGRMCPTRTNIPTCGWKMSITMDYKITKLTAYDCTPVRVTDHQYLCENLEWIKDLTNNAQCFGIIVEGDFWNTTPDIQAYWHCVCGGDDENEADESPEVDGGCQLVPTSPTTTQSKISWISTTSMTSSTSTSTMTSSPSSTSTLLSSTSTTSMTSSSSISTITVTSSPLLSASTSPMTSLPLSSTSTLPMTSSNLLTSTTPLTETPKSTTQTSVEYTTILLASSVSESTLSSLPATHPEANLFMANGYHGDDLLNPSQVYMVIDGSEVNDTICYNGNDVTEVNNIDMLGKCSALCIPLQACIGVNFRSGQNRCDLVQDVNIYQDSNLFQVVDGCRFFIVVFKQ